MLEPNGEDRPYWDSQAKPDRVLDRWIELLHGDGRVVLIEGRDDPLLWGGPIDDERYLVISPSRA